MLLGMTWMAMRSRLHWLHSGGVKQLRAQHVEQQPPLRQQYLGEHGGLLEPLQVPSHHVQAEVAPQGGRTVAYPVAEMVLEQ